MTPNQRRALLVAIGLIIMAVSYFRSGKADQVVFLYFGAIAAILGALLWVFENYLWRLPFLYSWGLSVPNIRGSWTGNGVENPKAGAPEKLEAGSITIRQTYSSIHVAISWKSGAVSRLYESAPFKASGQDTTYLAFIAMYSYTREMEQQQTRQVCASIEITERARRPKNFAINYATIDGSRSGRIDCRLT